MPGKPNTAIEGACQSNRQSNKADRHAEAPCLVARPAHQETKQRQERGGDQQNPEQCRRTAPRFLGTAFGSVSFKTALGTTTQPALQEGQAALASRADLGNIVHNGSKPP